MASGSLLTCQTNPVMFMMGYFCYCGNLRHPQLDPRDTRHAPCLNRSRLLPPRTLLATHKPRLIGQGPALPHCSNPSLSHTHIQPSSIQQASSLSGAHSCCATFDICNPGISRRQSSFQSQGIGCWSQGRDTVKGSTDLMVQNCSMLFKFFSVVCSAPGAATANHLPRSNPLILCILLSHSS